MPYYYRRKKKKRQEISTDNPKVKVTKKTDYVDKLDRIFSKYIRLRDAMPSGFIRCISCGQIKEFDRFDCGHYYSRMHMSTRWDEDNCNAECSLCNRFSAEHLIGYRENLIKKIGENRFKLLEVKAHQTKQWSEFELKMLCEYYQKKVKELSKEKCIDVK